MYIEADKVLELIQQIKAHSRIIIHRHSSPDPDAIGSQLGLKQSLALRYPDKTILAAGSISKGLSWLGSMDRLTKDDYEGALVIVTDTANTPRIDGKYYDLGSSLIKIDHHPPVDNYGDLALVYPQASSTCELIALLCRDYPEDFPINQGIASLLYAGLIGDTGRFMFNSTSQLSFEVAAFLMGEGIDAHAINDRMEMTSPNEAKFQGYVLNHLTIHEDGIAYLIVDQELMDQFDLSEEETNSSVNLASRIQGVLAWAMFVERKDQDKSHYRVRIRSKGPVINELASRHHGGGHAMASGANAYSQEEIQEIIEELRLLVVDYKKEKKI